MVVTPVRILGVVTTLHIFASHSFAIALFRNPLTPSHKAAEPNSTPIWRASGCVPRNKNSCPSSYLSRPPTLLISFDGFWAGYLERNITPAISHFGNCGVRAAHTISTHPSITFPNHYSIVTGLNTESHGIVDNVFYDPNLKDLFNYKNQTSSSQSKWWNGEPIWVTAKKQGKRANSYFWVGSEAEIQGIRPDVWLPYNESHTFEDRMDTVLKWLSSPDKIRPDSATVYFEEPDTSGHLFGPQPSEDLDDALRNVDKIVDRLMEELYHKKLLGCINIVIVSDHGMQESSCNRTIGIKEMLEDSTLNGSHTARHVVVQAVSLCQARIGLGNDSNAKNLDMLYDALSCPAQDIALPRNSPYQTYRKQHLPRRLHYFNSNRIEPIVMDLIPSYTVFASKPAVCPKRGVHGYDNAYASMQSIFLANGPAFKVDLVVEPFKNIEIYNLLCELLDIIPAPNNGTFGSMHHILQHPRNLTSTKKAVLESSHIAMEQLTRKQLLDACSLTAQRNDDMNIDNTTKLPSALLHSPTGIPISTSDLVSHILVNQESLTGYNQRLGVPVWSSFVLSKPFSESSWHLTPNRQCFDPRLANTTARQRETLEKLVQPARLQAVGSKETHQATESDLDSNLIPMYPSFREGTWKVLWNLIVNWTVSSNDSLHVCLGPVFDYEYPLGIADPIGTSRKTYGNHDIPIPSHYFAVVLRHSNLGRISGLPADAVSFILPHVTFDPEEACQDNITYLWTHSASIDDVEQITNLHFLSDVPFYDAVRLRIKQPVRP